MAEAFQAILDCILVKPDAPRKASAGGILIGPGVQDLPMFGEVLAAGPGRHDGPSARHPMTVHQGDRVCFHKTTGVAVTIGGEDYLVMRDTDVLGVLE